MTRRPPIPAKDAWVICSFCPPDDNVWPGSAFSHSSGSHRHKTRICNACWQERYRRAIRNCVVCGYRSTGWARKDRNLDGYQCRKCRKAQGDQSHPGASSSSF